MKEDSVPQIPLPRLPGPARGLLGVVGFVFGGCGLCMLALIWGEESSIMPVPARLFGSLICLAFVAFGGTMLFGAITGGGPLGKSTIELPEVTGDSPAPPPSSSPAGYHCP